MRVLTEVYFLEIPDTPDRHIIKHELSPISICEEVYNSSIINDIISCPNVQQFKPSDGNLELGLNGSFIAISIENFAEILYNSIINAGILEDTKNYLLSVATPWTVGIEIQRRKVNLQ